MYYDYNELGTENTVCAYVYSWWVDYLCVYVPVIGKSCACMMMFMFTSFFFVLNMFIKINPERHVINNIHVHTAICLLFVKLSSIHKGNIQYSTCTL